MKTTKSNQDMFLSIIEHVAFPEMDSQRIINDLRQNPDLWLACSVERRGMVKDDGKSLSFSLDDFFSSRGKEDTLGICSSNVDNDKLFEIAKQWGADTIEWKPKRTDSPDELMNIELHWNRNV